MAASKRLQLAVLDPNREAPADIAYSTKVEASACQWCRWSGVFPPLTCAEPRYRDDPWCARANPSGECDHYSLSLLTRLLRKIGLRRPAWRSDADWRDRHQEAIEKAMART